MGRVTKVWRLAPMGAVLALVLSACAPPGTPGGGGTTTTTAAPTTTVAPSTTSTAPTTTPTTTAPTSTTATTAPPPTVTATTTTTVPPGSGGAGFGEVVSVSGEGYDSSLPRVAVDRQGDALLTWVRVSHEYPYQYAVEARSHAHDGTWGPIVTVAPPGEAPHGPTVAVDDDGDAVVVWDAFSNNDYRVNARRMSGTGTLGPVQVLSAPGTGIRIHGTDVAVDDDGDAVVLWAERQPDGGVVAKMRRLARDGTLSAEVVVSSGRTAVTDPAVAVDREGDAVLAWANDNIVQARTLTASGRLGPVETVSPDLSPIDRYTRPRVTLDRDGDAVVAFVHWSAAGQSDHVWGRWLSRDGTVGPVRLLTPESHTAISNFSLAGDLDGDVLLAWDRFPSAEMYVRRIPHSATLGEPTLVTSYGRFPTVRVDDDGDGVLTWQGEGIDGAVGSVRARRVAGDGTLGTPQVVAPSGVYPTSAVGPAGGALVTWERRFQVDLRIQASAAP
jgi:hypothetical protein